MVLFLVVAGVYAAVVGACLFVFVRFAARIWPWLSVPAAFAALYLAALALTPVPVHGGFTFLLPELIGQGLRDMKRSWRARAKRLKEERQERRFTGFLEAPYGDGTWRDPASGLVWSPPVLRGVPVSPASLARARELCRSRELAGRWDIPRDAEFHKLSNTPRADGVWLAEAFLWPEELSLPTMARLGRRSPAGLDPGQRGGPTLVDARCVAVTPPAPRRGYRSADIPRDEWNRRALGL